MLDAALALLAEGGPAAVTHRAVAERTGSSLGSVTYHFAAKVDLLHEVYRLHLARVRDRAESIGQATMQQRPGPPNPARFADGLLRYLEQGVREDRDGSLATFELALERARDPALRRRLRAVKGDSDAFAAEQFAALGSSEPDTDAALVIAALDGLRLAWLSNGERSDFAKRVPAVVARLAALLWQADEGEAQRRRAR
jgi:AcrR family transcriptional regulator